MIKALKYNMLNQQELNAELIRLIDTHDYDGVKHILTSSDMVMHADIHTDDDYCLLKVCSLGYLNFAKYLLTSPDLKEHANINAKGGQALVEAAKASRIDLIQYLLFSPELKEHINIHAHNDSMLVELCEIGELEYIEYVLTSPELKEHSNPFAQNSQCFKKALFFGRLEIIEYLLTSPKLKKNIDSACINNEDIFCMIERGGTEACFYLIDNFNLNIDKNLKKRIVMALKLKDYREIFKRIESRDLKNMLEENLEEKKDISQQKI